MYLIDAFVAVQALPLHLIPVFDNGDLSKEKLIGNGRNCSIIIRLAY